MVWCTAEDNFLTKKNVYQGILCVNHLIFKGNMSNNPKLGRKINKIQPKINVFRVLIKQLQCVC